MSASSPTDRQLAAAAGLDLAAVVVFVAVGRRSHDEGDALRATLSTALPFVAGLAVAWVTVRAWRRPTWLLTGVAIWPVTVLVGMILRRWVVGRGTAASFVVVATVFLGACFVGWRAVAAVLERRRTAGASGAAATSRVRR